MWEVGGWHCVGSLHVGCGVCGLLSQPGGLAGVTEEGDLLFAREGEEGWELAPLARPPTSGSAFSSGASGHAIAGVAGRLLFASADSNVVRSPLPSAPSHPLGTKSCRSSHHPFHPTKKSAPPTKITAKMRPLPLPTLKMPHSFSPTARSGPCTPLGRFGCSNRPA